METRVYGGTRVLPFTSELRDAIGFKDNDTEVLVMLDEGKHGKFLAIFKEAKK
jgi:hypothetical protein